MRFQSSLEELFSEPSHVRVLRALWKNSPSRSTGREIAILARTSPAQTARVLRNLQDFGLASAEAAGRSFLWRWNPDHVWGTVMRSAFEQESSLREELVRDLSGILHGLPVRKAILFGSVARGQERSDSDIDLFVETPTGAASEQVRNRLNARRTDLWKKYGNPLSPLILTSAETRTGPGPALVRSIEEDGVVLEV